MHNEMSHLLFFICTHFSLKKGYRVHLILTCMGQMRYDRVDCAPCFLLTARLAYSSTKMEVTHSYKTLADFRQTTWHYIPEDRSLQDS